MIDATKKLGLFLSVILVCVQINAMDLDLIQYMPGNNTVMTKSQATWTTCVMAPLVGVVGAMLHDKHVPTREELGEVAIIGVAAGVLTAYYCYNLTPEQQRERSNRIVNKAKKSFVIEKRPEIEAALDNEGKEEKEHCAELNKFFLKFCEKNDCTPLTLHEEASNVYTCLSYEEKRLQGISQQQIANGQESQKEGDQKNVSEAEVTDIRKFAHGLRLNLGIAQYYHCFVGLEICELKKSQFNWKTKLSYLTQILSLPLIIGFMIALAQRCGFEIQLPSQVPAIINQVVLPASLFSDN